MKRYAVLSKDNIVTNVINANSKELAESLTLSTCILVTEATDIPHIGFSYENNVFIQPQIEESE